MSRCLIFVMCAFLLISGCTGQFYRVKDRQVTFYLELPAAKQVYFAYSLDEFRLHKVQKNQAGTWEISIPADIEFRYFFMVDGAVHLPECDIREADDFGSENCIFEPAP
jgi:1,4-alpha-glucan branching enzyme